MHPTPRAPLAPTPRGVAGAGFRLLLWTGGAFAATAGLAGGLPRLAGRVATLPERALFVWASLMTVTLALAAGLHRWTRPRGRGAR